MNPPGAERLRRIRSGTEWVGTKVGFFRESFASVESRWKEDASRVTQADLQISEAILGAVRETFPEDDPCSEESGAEAKRELSARFSWILDPVDGTNNFAIGLPNCAISLALLENGLPVYGWVYDYAGDRLIHGGSGVGLFEGEKPREPCVPDDAGDTPIGLQFPLPPSRVEALKPLLHKERIRSLGSGTMTGVYVALGLLAGAVDFRVKVWDIAAFMAFFEATGTQCFFPEGSPFPLRSFDPAMAPTPYVAGSQGFCGWIREMISPEPHDEVD